MNVAQKPKSLRFRIVPATVESANGQEVATSKVEWLDETDYSADDLCKPNGEASGSLVDDAVDFLKQLLADGPVSAIEGKAAAEELDISSSTLQRARKKLGVKPKKTASGWDWYLPEPKK
jgi:hypothetical protein